MHAAWAGKHIPASPHGVPARLCVARAPGGHVKGMQRGVRGEDGQQRRRRGAPCRRQRQLGGQQVEHKVRAPPLQPLAVCDGGVALADNLRQTSDSSPHSPGYNALICYTCIAQVPAGCPCRWREVNRPAQEASPPPTLSLPSLSSNAPPT